MTYKKPSLAHLVLAGNPKKRKEQGSHNTSLLTIMIYKAIEETHTAREENGIFNKKKLRAQLPKTEEYY